MCFAPSIPEPTPPPPPPPTPEDPAIALREKEVASSERRRKGRRASQLTPENQDELGTTNVDRTSARDGAQLLGS